MKLSQRHDPPLVFTNTPNRYSQLEIVARSRPPVLG